MPRDFDRLEQLAFTQLVDLAQDRSPGRFEPNGSFVKGFRGDRSYWYYQGFRKSPDGGAGATYREYVGPVGDEAAESARAEHEARHARYRERRRIASGLRRMGLPAPSAFDGAVIDALSNAGVFEAGAVLIGSAAFQTYPGLLGTGLDGALMQTGDVDLGRPRRVAVPGVLAASDVEGWLKKVDPSFRPILDRANPGVYGGYVNDASYKVEFLTSGARRKDAATAMVPLSGMGGASAQPVSFLEFLLDQPVRSLVLHGDGVPVTVPDPARYAVHKLIVARMRERVAEARGTRPAAQAKIAKDVDQAAALVCTLVRRHRASDLAAAWEEAWRRGPKWRDHLGAGVAKLDVSAKGLLETTVLENAGPAAWPHGASGAGLAPGIGDGSGARRAPRRRSGPTVRKGDGIAD